MATVTVEVPATTANLGPGFDCVGLALGLRNRVTAAALDHAEWSVTVEGAGAGVLPTQADNLVTVAMRRVFDRVPGAPRGARLHQINTIPLCSGLGSSAAAYVAGLVAANELCGQALSTQELCQIACDLEGHADNVLPALLGGLSVGLCKDGRAHYVRFDPPAGLKAVVILPDQELATSESRRALPEQYSRPDTVFNLGHAALLVAALVSGDHGALAAAMDDRVHQPYRLPLIPGAERALAAGRDAGAVGVVVSGAGPSLLALCERHADLVAEAMQAAFASKGVQTTRYLLEMEVCGARVVAR